MIFVLDKIGKLVTLSGAVQKKGRRIESSDLGIIEDGALVVDSQGRKSKVLWSGPRQSIPLRFKKEKKISAQGKMVMPGFVDSHTHLVFAGDRSLEFEMRLEGKSYSEIAQQGGGIVKTVEATRKISESALLKISEERVERFLFQGVTTLEIKTGYGLNFDTEKKLLNIISRLKKKSPVTILSTFLGAHAIPLEFKGRKEKYVSEVAEKWLPVLKNHTDFVDIFLDEGYFDIEDAKVLFQKANGLGLKTKIHADELALTGGSETAVKFGSFSADHLLKISDREIKLLAKSETTATLLPTTAFFLKTNYAPARKLLDNGARVALATDFNPGTSPTQDISLVGALAALQMGMRTEEIIVGLTLNGAYALNLEKQKGALLPDYDADFLLFDAESPSKIFYEFGKGTFSPDVFCSGKWITKT